MQYKSAHHRLAFGVSFIDLCFEFVIPGAKDIDVKNCSTKSQAKLYNLGCHYYQEILFYSLTVYSSLLNQVAIYSETRPEVYSCALFLTLPITEWAPEEIWTPKFGGLLDICAIPS